MSPDRNFIIKSLKIAAVITIIFAPFSLVYFNTSVAIGFTAGAVWNILNVYLLFQASNVLVPSEQADEAKKMMGIIAGIVKFPVLYGLGYVIIKYTGASLYGIIAGFSLIFVVLVLRAVGGSLTTGVSVEGKRGYGRSA